MARTDLCALDFHVSGVTGESWQFRRTALALSGAMDRPVEAFDHHPIASDVGEVGAAAPVLALAWLSQALRLPPYLTPGRQALLHMSNDSGEHAALVLRARKD
jgi:3-oxoacyl-[acyl-carrier-protein] synthase-1